MVFDDVSDALERCKGLGGNSAPSFQYAWASRSHSNGFRHVPNSEVIRHCIHTRVEWRLETD